MFVIRDLVVDQTLSYEQYASIKPWLMKKTKAVSYTHLTLPTILRV